MSLFCRHKWKLIKIIEVYDDRPSFWVDFGYEKSDIPIYHKYVLQCEKCGKLKTKKV